MSLIVDIGVDLWDAFGTIGQWFFQLGDKLDDIPLVGGAIEDICDWIGRRFLDVAIFVMNAAYWADDLWDRVTDIYGAVQDAWDWVFDQGKKLWDWFLNIDDWFYQSLWPYISGFLGEVADWFVGAYGNFINAGQAVIDWFAGIDDWFADHWTALFTPWWLLIEPLADFVDAMGGQMVDFLNEPAEWMWEKLKGFLETIADEVTDLMERILDRVW